jgi:hypothetical protein
MDVPQELVLLLPTPESRLSEREASALRVWSRISATQPKLSPDTQARFYALFLQGSSFEDIARLNRGFSVGQIIECACNGNWFQQKDDYLEDLLKNVRGIVQQTAVESISFIATQLSAVHKKFGDSAKRYIQTGDESELRGFGIDGIKEYKVAIEALQKLTGQEGKTTQDVTVHHVEASPSTERRALSAIDAASIVKKALGK